MKFKLTIDIFRFGSQFEIAFFKKNQFCDISRWENQWTKGIRFVFSLFVINFDLKLYVQK